MEQPPGSLDSLQPQDLTTFSVPTLIDLTRKGEECVLNATSPDALQMVKSPGRHPNSETSNPGLPSDTTFQSGDRIPPADAFSHTTVTLSYVSRSHSCSAPDSLSLQSPLRSTPPVSKFSLHPPRDTDKGLGESGCTPNQHYMGQAERPVDLATQTKHLQSLSQEQQENNGRLCHTINGVISNECDVDENVQEEQERSISQFECRVLENGEDHSCSSCGICADSSPEPLAPVRGEEKDVVFLSSKKQDPVLIQNHLGARDLSSQTMEYKNPLEDPVSPSATSLDDVEDAFDLPQASSSPSASNSYLEAAEEAAWDGSNTEGAIQPGSGITDSSARLDSSSKSKKPVYTVVDLTDDGCEAEDLGDKPTAAVPHMNGNAKTTQRTLTEKKLPPRSGRGVQLEAIVMNINSSKYKVSGYICTNKKASASQSTASDCNSPSPKTNSSFPVGKRRSRAIAASSVKKVKHKTGTQVKRGKTNDDIADKCKDSTSTFEILNNSKQCPSSSPPKSPKTTVCKTSKKVPEDGSCPSQSPQTSPATSKRRTSSPSEPHLNSAKDPEPPPHAEPSLEVHVESFSPSPSKSPKKSQGKGKAAGVKTSPTAKTKAARAPKRRRKKLKQSSSMFSPEEPEIKLKYVNFKEEKRDVRLDSFSPFVRVERQQPSPSRCTVINYPEEARTQHRRGPQPHTHPSGFISATVPSTSCLQLGRVSMHSQLQRPLVCCLCGRAANAMDLGDLHGPYYPEGFQPSTKTPASASGLRAEEDGYSDSDSSTCSVKRSRGRARPVPSSPRPLRTGAQLKPKGLLGSHRLSSDRTNTPAAKRVHLEGPSANEDWYSPPTLPLEPCEYWLHEDCGIWSAGVFLVKGRVYGLEEAVRAAQETMCSACADPGATLGCFFKSCPNKYHYRCALESDCVLIEENFSMKCKKHKNKTFKAPPGNRWDDR